MELVKEIELAAERIRPFVRVTYLEHSPVLSDHAQAHVFLKLENLQHTGSFKVRGAMNKLISLTPDERHRGCVAASTGNHGAAVAYGLAQLGIDGTICVPTNASETKIRAIERLGGSILRYGTDGAETELFARRYAAEKQMTYISPYNDPYIIAGQGTVAKEMCVQLDPIDAVFASLGGGGLISGIATYFKALRPQGAVVGCSPENSQVMIQSVRANRLLDLASQPTLSDGTAGGIEPGAITFDLCRTLVDAFETVTEEEIAQAMRLVMDAHHLLIEGAAGVAVAAFLKRQQSYKDKNVVIVLCGANLDLGTLRRVLG